MKEIKRWYNGYRFTSEEARVYNPFSTLLLFDKEELSNYWFETGTPTFLTKLLAKQPRLIPTLKGYRFKANRLSGATEE